MPHIIDTTVTPFVPDGFTVLQHRTNGPLVWNPDNIKMFQGSNRIAVPEDKKDDMEWRELSSAVLSEGASGFDIIEEMEKKFAIPLNSNVLEFLIKNQELIPEEWKTCHDGIVPIIYFLGTIYNKGPEKNNSCICYLYWDKTHWDWSYSMLDNKWDEGSFAAMS